jgi:hypothetical protein
MPRRSNPKENLHAFNVRLRPDQIAALKQFAVGRRSELVRRAIDVILFAPDLAEKIETQLQKEIDVRKSLGILGHGLSPTTMTNPSVSARRSGGLSPSHSIVIVAGAAAQPALASSRNSTQEAEEESKKFSCSPEN